MLRALLAFLLRRPSSAQDTLCTVSHALRKRRGSSPRKKVSTLPFAMYLLSHVSSAVIPIVGQTSDPSTWLPLVASLDVVIDAVGGTEVKTLSETLLNAVAATAQSARPVHAPKLTYIYSSGTWVHGDDRTTIKTDISPITAPAGLVAWRPEQEQRVVTNTILNGVVIRPGMLYGRSGSLFAPLFQSASEGKVRWFGTPEDRYALIHADDLAELYLLAAEKGQLVGGKIFDAVNDFTESADDLLKKLVKVSGAQGPHEFVKPSNCECSSLIYNVT